MSRNLKTALAATLAATLSACAAVEVGHNFDTPKFQTAVKRGVTTQAEVKTLLGTPTSTGMVVDTDGKQFTRWLYYYGKGTPPKFADTQFKMIEVQFDENKIVQGYNWSGN